jgi:hypothetical protein
MMISLRREADILQPLTCIAFQRKVSAVLIFKARSDTIALTASKICAVAVQVLFAAVLIDTFHAALEDRKVAFNRVRLHLAGNVFASR